MRRYKTLLVLLTVMMSAMRIMAQEVSITVTTTQQILPPQILLYLTDPGKFFNVSISNTSSEDQYVYLGLQLEHLSPNDGLSIATPPQYQPNAPFIIPAGGNYNLTTVDMMNLFNHIPASAMQIPDGLMDGYQNGSFGLLPEGTYEVRFQAYQWKMPKYAEPVACSHPMSGRNTFQVCYNASAPTFLTPFIGLGLNDLTMAELDVNNPQFTWTQPVVTCNPLAFAYTYTLRIVELMEELHQQPDVAMDNNPVVYQSSDLLAPILILDNITLKTKFEVGKAYVAQVTAVQSGASATNYVNMTNGGKSPLRVFRLVDKSKNEDDEDDEKKGDDFDFDLAMVGAGGASGGDTLYAFRNPTIISPHFEEGDVRRLYKEADIYLTWDPAWYISGTGENPYDLEMAYTVQLYNGKEEADTAKAFATEPIYTETVTENKHTIPWDDIKDKVNVKDYVVVRVKPSCTNLAEGDSINFVNDSINVMDFTMSERISPQFFECSNSVVIENFDITTKTAEDFIGKEIGLGEYQLTIDKIESGDAQKGFKGLGRVKWELPLGTAMVHVKFDTLRINTDDIAIGGLASSYAEDKMTNYQAVENIFSDLGLEDMLARQGVPYADKITSGGKKTIAEKVDGIANYYSLAKSAGSIYDLMSGGTADIYMPICLPKDKVSDLNSSPVDIQITTMKFAPTWATMDLIGEFTMPGSECLASDLLVFGAPRLCISPNHLIPEAGTMALLGNFTVKDPSTDFECTFNAPQNLLTPSDGCYVAWKDYKFEVMGVDIDMKIPKLKKYDEKADKVTDEIPNLKMVGQIASWDDFKIENVTMDAFEAEELPGFTFKASNISYDHSLNSNTAAMSSFKFPDGYDKQEGVGEDEYVEYGLNGWEGLYIGEISVAMPKGISGTDGRLKIAGKNMLFDRSGVTLDADLEELIGAKVGDFSFEINRVGLTFIQSNFDNCHIDGKLSVPLLKSEKGEAAEIGLNCQIRKQIDEKGKKGDEFVYVFNTKSLTGDYVLDVFLAKLVLDDKLTYMVVEAEPEKTSADESKLKTRCELLMGGLIEIGGKETIEQWGKDKVGYKLSLPDIHFVGMRLANCKAWKSKYTDIQVDIDQERKKQKSEAMGGLFLEGKEMHNGKKDDGSDATFFFHTGSWSLASYKKQLGPFEFSLEDYNIKKNFSGSNLSLGLEVTGKVALVKGIDIAGEVSLDINGKMTNIGTDLSKISGEFDGVKLKTIGVDASFCGMTVKGSVEFTDKGDNPDVGKGFAATLDITLPGELFTVHGDGGYFDYDNNGEQYSWGWVHLSIGGKIELGPCAITKLGGGFYMNCSRNPAGDKEKPKNVAGLVGIFMELGMATPDGETLKGELTLNVVYNRKRKCLSNFTMTGTVKAVGGIINSKMTLVYENSEKDRYLQINITTDASLSSESMAGALDSFGANLGTIKEQMQQLAGDKFQEIVTDCKQGLSSKIGAKANDADADKDPDEISTPEENAANVAAKSQTSKQGGLPKMGATISLDVKITWRAGGTNYAKPKWHVYLGEPAEDKRCTLTLIDFDSGIVDCHVGANAYVCVGNELPNNGELPPLPDKIAKFLDGSKHGDFQSDNAAQAQSARQMALQGFNGDISGGVMMGAMAYGDITINLGLLKGKLEAILGFDVSVVHYKNGICVNLGKIPGYRGWYGKGQLYAYLYFLLAVHFNLGFVTYDIDLASAEIGGVLKMGGPSPNYFQGKARAKIRLLGGLFTCDKSFEFDCGQYCQLFKGNPLDDFILFDDCTLGDTIRTKGWTEDKDKTASVSADMQPKVKKNVSTPQYVNSVAPLTEHFRLLDENELERIAGQFGEGSEEWERSKMQAKRTFIFRDFGEVWLYEYDKPSDYTQPAYTPSESATFESKKGAAMQWCGAKRMYTIPLEKGGGKSRHYINLGELRKNLKAGKFYRLVAAGYAKEIQRGVEVDPYTYYNGGKKVGNIAWVKATEYYFQTEKENVVNDKAPLQDYVAIAYPSHYNQLRSPESDTDKATGAVKHIKAYLGDVQAPTIALTEDIRSKAFRNGKLYWRLLSPMGKQLDIVENAWVTGTPLQNGNIQTINMEPKRRLNAQAGEKYILQLDYYTREYVAEDEFNPNDKKWQTMDTTLVKLYVETLPADKNWGTGPGITIGNGLKSCTYDQPFIAQKMTQAIIKRPYSGTKTDTEIHQGNYYTKCPFTYISYMSNFVFPAGWEITERGFFGIEVTTSESMIFQDPGKGGKYEGKYTESETYRSHNGFDDVKNTVVYTVPTTYSQLSNGKIGYQYPIQYPLSKYWHENGYGDWDYVHDVDDRIMYYQPTSSPNEYKRVAPVFESIKKVYSRTSWISDEINGVAISVENEQRKYEKPSDDGELTYQQYLSNVSQEYYTSQAISKKKDMLRQWYANHRGTYISENGRYEHALNDYWSFYVPVYQFPVLWSICALENIDGAYRKMSNNNDRAQIEGPVWSKMTGMTWYKGFKHKYKRRTGTGRHKHTVTHTYWDYYEVPAETQQKFNSDEAKKLFKEAYLTAYRVNSYDINSGHYWVVNNLLNGRGYFNMSVDNPVTDKPSAGVTSEHYGNTSGTSFGTTQGGSVTGIDTSVSTSSLSTSQMEKYMRLIVAMHDSCAIIYKLRSPYWSRYEKWADKLAKAALNAEKTAINAVTFYANCEDSVRYRPNITHYRTQVKDYIDETKKWRDSVNHAMNWLSPKATFASPKYRSIEAIVKNLNYYMDTYITPQSDPNNTQYQRYRSMQDEANSWNTKLSAWRDSIYSSRWKEGGYSKVHVDKAEWARKEIWKMKPENKNAARKASLDASVCRNMAEGNISEKCNNAYDKAEAALDDAKKKCGVVDQLWDIKNDYTLKPTTVRIVKTPDGKTMILTTSDTSTPHQTRPAMDPSMGVDATNITSTPVGGTNVMGTAAGNLLTVGTPIVVSKPGTSKKAALKVLKTEMAAAKVAVKAEKKLAKNSIKATEKENRTGGMTMAGVISTGETAQSAPLKLGVPVASLSKADMGRIRQITDANANYVAVLNKNITNLKQYISDQQAVISDLETVDNSLQILKANDKILEGYVNKISREDGYLQIVKDNFNDQCAYYRNTNSYLNVVQRKDESVKAMQSNINKALKRLPTKEEVKQNIENAKRKLDQAEGRDTLTADRLMGRVDSLLAVVQNRLSKFETEDMRRSGYDKLQGIYSKIVQAKKDYMKGDLTKIPICINGRAEYQEALARYREYYTELSHIPSFIQTAAEPVWEGFHSAGFDDSHETVQKARKLWTDENRYDEAVNSLNQVKAWFNEMEAHFTKGEDNVEGIYSQAKQDQENPSVELKTKAVRFAIDKLSALKYRAQLFDSMRQTLNSETSNSIRSFETRKKNALQEWSNYEALMPNIQTPSYEYAAALKRCSDACVNAENVAGELQRFYEFHGWPQRVQEASNLISEAQGYMDMISGDNSSVPSYQALYNSAKAMAEEIKKPCQQVIDAAEALIQTYQQTLPDLYAKEIGPLKAKVEEAQAYLDKNGKPKLNPEITIPGYLNSLTQQQAKAAADAVKVNKLYRTNTTDFESFMTARNRMNTYWSNYMQLRKQGASVSSQRTALNNCTAQAQIMIDLAPKITGAYTEVADITEAEISSLTYANAELSYIRENAQVNPQAYTKATRLVDQIRTSVQSLSTKKPTMQTRAQNVRKYVPEANQMKTQAAKENRSLGSKVIRR